MTSSVYPELVHGRRDGFEQGAWIVEPGSTSRGGASCNLSQRILRVPSGVDELARVVRAHELMHIRVSPFLSEHIPLDVEVSIRALECAEEFRINYLLSMTGFDTTVLRDGTERPGGRRLAAAGQWDEAVCFFLAVLGTGGEGDYLRGIRPSQSSWPPALRALKKRVLAIVTQMEPGQIADTRLNCDGVPQGYHDVTLPVARLVSRSMNAAAPGDPESLRVFRRSLETGARRAPSGVFAPLLFDPSVNYVATMRRKAHRRNYATTSGTVMRYPTRLLTDPMQRAFARKKPAPGGIIVIDQSGSMDVTASQLDALLKDAPDAMVVGYSHRPGDAGRTPNAWVLAHRGRVAREVRTGNIGNGVDGPILHWAVRAARGREPVVWVTDGQVTDSHDRPCHSLSLECARLVKQHRILMVRSIGEVEGAIRGHRGPKGAFGRVGQELLGIRG